MSSSKPTSPSNIHSDHLIMSDELTGRPNRCLFLDRMQQAMKRCCRGQHLVGLLYLDIDYFRYVNETHGREVGDDVLKRFSEVLTNSIRATDTVARLKEDDFVILMEDMHSAGDVELVVKKVLGQIRQPMPVAGIVLNVTVSIGVVVYAGENVDAEYLLNKADQALYRAKNSGRDRVSF